MTGYDYEYTVAAYLKYKGYSGVKVTQGSGDYGVDVLARKGNRKYAVQCKYYSKPVGVKAVQEAVAGVAYYGCDRAMVVTNNTFTSQAKELAKANNVVLLENVVGASTSRKSIFRVLLMVAICFIYFLWYYMMSNIISVRINDPNVHTSFKNVIELTLMTITPVGLPVLAVLLKKKIKSGKYRYKHIYFVESNTGSEDKIYQQRDKSDYMLDNSAITGLPHKFSIMGESFDIDKVEDIENMPLNFSSFSVSGTRYYFNNYFRLCAKLYQKAGYKENAKALRKKAKELELDPQHGKYIRGKAKTFIRLPKESEFVEQIELSHEEQIEKTACQFDTIEKADTETYLRCEDSPFVIDCHYISGSLNADEVTQKVIEELAVYRYDISVAFIERKCGLPFIKAKKIIDDLVSLGFIFKLDEDEYMWDDSAYIEAPKVPEINLNNKNYKSEEQLDPLFENAVDTALEMGTVSISILQRKLSIGYSRGATIINQMEKNGIVGKLTDDSNAREVIINHQQWLEMIATK